jgi:hypothetical protein
VRPEVHGYPVQAAVERRRPGLITATVLYSLSGQA